MRSTGVTRPVDQLGRVVLPKELRKSLEIVENETRLEIFVDGKDIILRKHEAGCMFCEEARDVKEYMGKRICSKCMKSLKAAK